MTRERPPIPEGKRALINGITTKDRQAFMSWRNQQPALPTLDLTHEVARFLIPPRTFELAIAPENITVRLDIKKPERLRLHIVETKRAVEGIDVPLKSAGEKALEQGDYYFNTISLTRKDECLYLNLYGDRDEYHGEGVATSFFERFREFALQMNFRYTMGSNGRGSRGFFLTKLNWDLLTNLPASLQRELLPALDKYAPPEEHTVDVLYPEDLSTTRIWNRKRNLI